MTDLLAAVADLVAIRSTADRPESLGRALDFVLDLVGPGFTVQRFSPGSSPSALVFAGDSRPHFRVLLNAHLDVVPGTDDQFRARRDGDRLYGRGTHDMKAAAVVLASVFRDLAREVPYPLGLQLVTDEEVGGYEGTGHQVSEGVSADFVIIGEQSGLRVVTESKGICQVRLDAPGVSSHAAYPWLGSNALLTLTSAVSALVRRYPVPASESWTTTATLSRIVTGMGALNQVPASAAAWFDIRFPAGDADFSGRSPDEIATFLADVAGGRVSVRVENLGAPHAARAGSADVALLRREGGDAPLLRKHGAADGRFYSAHGIDAVIFGPGGAGQHGPDEYLDIATLDPYRRALTRFLTGVTT